MTTPQQTDRAVGSVIGMVTGDALGAGYEFGPPLSDGTPVFMKGGGGFECILRGAAHISGDSGRHRQQGEGGGERKGLDHGGTPGKVAAKVRRTSLCLK